MATVLRLPCRLSGPPRGSGDSPSTVWYRVSFPMPKDPRTGRPDAWKGSDTCSPGSPLRGRASERGIGFSINGSAERHVTWIGRRPEHHMVPGQPHNAQKSPCRPTRCEQSLPRCPRRPIRHSPRALIGPRFACLRPARASLSLGELSRYHTVGGGSPGPRSEPMSRQRDQCAPHDRGVAGHAE